MYLCRPKDAQVPAFSRGVNFRRESRVENSGPRGFRQPVHIALLHKVVDGDVACAHVFAGFTTVLSNKGSGYFVDAMTAASQHFNAGASGSLRP